MKTSFNTPAAGVPAMLGQLKAVPMKMNGMDVIAGVAHAYAVTLASRQAK